MSNSNSTDLDVVDGELVGPVAFALTPAELKAQLNSLLEVQNDVLTVDVDYGVIAGTKKASLYKPGAEKMLFLYGLATRTDIIDKTEDWDRPFFRYTVRIQLVKKATGEVVGDGIGDANLWEKRYLVKSCKHRRKDNGWWPDDHSNAKCYNRPSAEELDYATTNTLLKMARKRALVDAVLGCTMASHIFTQDVEDSAGAAAGAPTGGNKPSGDKPAKPAEPPADNLRERRMKTLFAVGKGLKKDEDAIKSFAYVKTGKTSMTDMTVEELESCIEAIQQQDAGNGSKESVSA